jgi:histidinol-phosphatase (PHP family)
MFDCHVHTKFSTDSKMKIEDALRRASDLNIGLIITEHMDLNYPIEGEFAFDPEDYIREYSKYRNDKLLLGVEMGIREDCFEENKALAQSYELDYIIGSVHVVDNIDLYESKFYEGRKKDEVYAHYLKAMLECVKKYDFIDSLGHIDYIARYARFEDNELYYNEFTEQIDEILKVLIEKEKAIELNTRRIGDTKVVESLIQIYKRYHELGGRIVTIGSDSHIPEHIGFNFGIAKEMVDICNLKMVYFKERKPNYL